METTNFSKLSTMLVLIQLTFLASPETATSTGGREFVIGVVSSGTARAGGATATISATLPVYPTDPCSSPRRERRDA